MNIVNKKISEIKAYEKNPRKNDDAVKYVANSIKEFGFKVPIVIDKNNVIVAGHTRVKAAKSLGMTEVPCIIADDLTEKQIKAFRLADNKTAEMSEWDFEQLANELAGITDLDMSSFGFEAEDEEGIADDDTYNNSIESPQYEITGENPPLQALADKSKCEELMNEINSAEDIPEDVKEFLEMAATRHIVFNYRNIAEYYAHAPKEVQELMEKSALVIIDFDDAIKNGFVKLNKDIEELMREDYGEASNE